MKTTDLDDAQVVGKVLRGQRELFGIILERYQRPIFNFIYRFYGNYDLAEELTQETFLRCYQFLKSYDPDRKFSTWLYTVAKNLCIDHYKKQRRGKEFSLDQALPSLERHEAMRSTETDPQIACIRSQEDARLLEALGELEPSRRVVLILFYFQGLSYQEIGEALGVPVSTVKIRIFRAKKALLEKMKGALESPEAVAGKRD
ncbi:RNA polymerase sigma factor [bacterium]|nr:RNA polymerase sigma factor [bacterium]